MTVKAHKAKRISYGYNEVLLMGIKGVNTLDARGRFYNRIGWDHGGGHVGLSSSLSVVHNYVELSLGNCEPMIVPPCLTNKKTMFSWS